MTTRVDWTQVASRLSVRISSPSPRVVLGVWALASLGVGVGMAFRTPIEQVNSLGFLFAGIFLGSGTPRANMVLAFAGFGSIVCAASARALLSLQAAPTWDGALIITSAWSVIAISAARHWAAATLVVLRERGVQQ